MQIQGLNSLQVAGISPMASEPGAFPAGSGISSTPSDRPFSSLMNELLDNVKESQATMDNDVTRVASGESENVHEVVLNAVQADLMFRMSMEVRDRLISTYQDVMRMQI